MTLPTSSGSTPPETGRIVRRKWVLYWVAGLCLAGCCLLGLIPQTVEIRDGEEWGWGRSATSLKQIGWAFHAYHQSFGQLPPAVVKGKDGQPLFSWRVLLLPFIEQQTLYDQFHLDEPWDSPHNKPLSEKTPRWSYEPAGGGQDSPGLTRYQVFVGPGTAFERDGLTWADFTDDHSKTLLVVEGGEPVPWSKPVDLVYDPGKPLPPLGGVFTKPVHFLGFKIGRKPGFTACFADGTVSFIRSDTDEATLRALIIRNGGEKVDASRLR